MGFCEGVDPDVESVEYEHAHGHCLAGSPRIAAYAMRIEFIPICGRTSRGSNTWLTRSSTSIGCGSTLSIAVSSAIAAAKTEAAYGRWAAAIG